MGSQGKVSVSLMESEKSGIRCVGHGSTLTR